MDAPSLGCASRQEPQQQEATLPVKLAPLQLLSRAVALVKRTCQAAQGLMFQRACSLLTVGFLYGAGAETLIFVTGTSEKISETSRLPAEKPKSAVDTQKTKKNRCLGIRC